jgi:hypothetical protein
MGISKGICMHTDLRLNNNIIECVGCATYWKQTKVNPFIYHCDKWDEGV